MSATFNWTIENLECKPTEGDNTNIVTVIHWRCTGIEGENSATSYGSCNAGETSEEFTEFEDLTLDQVLGWCYNNGVDKTEVESNVQASLDILASPKTVNKTAPWVV